jgi:hypothetical protein
VWEVEVVKMPFASHDAQEFGEYEGALLRGFF